MNTGSIVSKLYDSTGVPIAIHSAVECPLEVGTNAKYYSRAAGERGTIEGLLGGRGNVWWWRHGGDVHVLAVTKASSGASSAFCDIQKAIVRMPAEAVSINVGVAGSSSNRNDGTIMAVVATSDEMEVVCARLELGIADGQLYLRTIADVFTSLPNNTLRTPITAAAAVTGANNDNDGGIIVLGGDKNGLLHITRVDNEGNASFAVAASNSSISTAAVAAIGAITNAADAAFIVARADGTISRYNAATDAEVLVMRIGKLCNANNGGAPNAVAATIAPSSGDVVVVVSTAGSDVVMGSGAIGSVLAPTHVPQPVDGAAVGSLHIAADGKTVVIGWLGCELWSVPTTAVAAYRKHDASISTIVGTYKKANCSGSGAFEGTQSLWLMPDGADAEPFWFTTNTVNDSDVTIFMAKASGIDGTASVHVANNATAISAIVATSHIGTYAPADVLNGSSDAADDTNVYDVTVVSLDSTTTVVAEGNTNEAALKAYRRGLELFQSIPNSVYSLQYLFSRALTSPSRFANFSEFSELRTDAFIASSFASAVDEVTEEDVRAALDMLTACEPIPNKGYATPIYAYEAILQDLGARLTFLIIVHAAWVTTTNSSFAASTVTAEVSHRADVLAAAIRAVQALRYDTHELAAAAVANMAARGDDSDDAAGNSATPIVSTVVSLLAQIGLGDVVDVAHVARILLSVAPQHGAGAKASAQWVSILKARMPAVGHFATASAVAAGSANAGSSAQILAELYAVAAHIAQLPTDAAKQLLAAMGLYAHHQYGLCPHGTTAAIAAGKLLADVEALIDGYPALAPKAYKALALRKALGSHGCVFAAPILEAALLPDVHIVRRYVASDDSLSALDAFLSALVIDANVVLCRAAIDAHQCAEALRLLAIINRESLTAATANGALSGNATTVTSARRDVITQYASMTVDRALADGKACELANATIVDADIVELVAQRLFVLSTASSAHHQQHSGVGSSATGRLTPQQAEQNEARRFACAFALNTFLTRRHAYGLAAHALCAIAAASRTANQTSSATMGYVVKLMTLALASAKCIPNVPAIPAHLADAAEDTRSMTEMIGSAGLTSSCSSGLFRQPSMAMGLAAQQLHDLTPMSRMDIALLEKRLFQARCELKLQRIPRNVVMGAWREDAADRTRMQRLVDELLTVRLWPDAFRMSQLAGLDTNAVYQCEAADLASSNYAANADVSAQWEGFIDRLVAASTSGNGYLPLKKALSAALHMNHRHVPARLKEELGQRDLGALIILLLNSGKLHLSSSGSSLPSAISSGDITRNSSTGFSVSAYSAAAIMPYKDRKLAGSVILDIMQWCLKYLKASEASLNADVAGRNVAMVRFGLWAGALITSTVLERVEVLAQHVIASATVAGAPSDNAARRKEITDCARSVIDILAKRNK